MYMYDWTKLLIFFFIFTQYICGNSLLLLEKFTAFIQNRENNIDRRVFHDEKGLIKFHLVW